MTEFIPYGKQNINEADLNAVLNVLKSDFLTQGTQVPLFEKSISEKVNSKFAVAVNSATSALHIACLSLGVGEGDYVWTSPISFVASSNCALYCGAKIDFVDIDTETFNMSVSELEKKLIAAKKENKLPKVVIPVHMAGQTCDMEGINKLGREYGFSIIEDASHCIGGKYKDKYIGNCDYSDIAIFSFHPVKIITTAEGGIATTNDKDLFYKMEMLRSHGLVRDKDIFVSGDPNWGYEQQELGYNYRMTEIQAALGTSQLNRLDLFIEQRHLKAKKYNDSLKGLKLDLPIQKPETYSAYHLYIIQVDNKNSVFDKLREKNIGVNIHYIPIHLQPYYKNLGFKKGDYPNAEAYFDRAISIPLFPDLSESMQDKVISSLKDLLG